MEWEKSVDTETNSELQTTRFLWGKALARWLAPSVPEGFNYDREAVKKFLTVTYESDTNTAARSWTLRAHPLKQWEPPLKPIPNS